MNWPSSVIEPIAPLLPPAAPPRDHGLWAWSILDGVFILILAFVLLLPLLGYLLYVDGAFNVAVGTPAFTNALIATSQTIEARPGRFFAGFLVQEIAFVLPVLLRIVGLRRLPLSWLGLTTYRFFQNAGFGLVLGVVTFGVNYALSQIFDRLGQHPNQTDMFPVRAGDYRGQILVFVAGAIIAPIVEELVFRGYIFNAWHRRWGAPIAYLVSATVFAVPHLAGVTQGQLGLLISIFTLGFLLAWGFHRTRSLLPGIIAHAMNNGVSLLTFIICTNLNSCK